ncbi:hypothetical protein KC842_01700 [Candidatus Nomurabacteria bacterium]|nr:hypothetical protein [Candidatus Nomurabacteria bacterium]
MPPLERDYQTSFIPKQPLTTPSSKKTREKPVPVLNVISTIIFFASILLAVGTYFYKGSVASSIASKADSLKRAQESFEPGFIEEIQDLDRRLSAAGEVLANHITVSPIMETLSTLTLQSVQFTDFKFSVPERNAGTILVTLKGKAKSYTSIALQSDALKEERAFIDPIFYNPTLDSKGGVTFDLDFTVDPKFLLYERNLDGGDVMTETVESGSTEDLTNFEVQ